MLAEVWAVGSLGIWWQAKQFPFAVLKANSRPDMPWGASAPLSDNGNRQMRVITPVCKKLGMLPLIGIGAIGLTFRGELRTQFFQTRLHTGLLIIIAVAAACRDLQLINGRGEIAEAYVGFAE